MYCILLALFAALAIRKLFWFGLYSFLFVFLYSPNFLSQLVIDVFASAAVDPSTTRMGNQPPTGVPTNETSQQKKQSNKLYCYIACT